MHSNLTHNSVHKIDSHNRLSRLPSVVFSNISCSSWNVGIVTPQLSPNRSQKANITAKFGSDAHTSCASATGEAVILGFGNPTSDDVTLFQTQNEEFEFSRTKIKT